MRGKGGARLWVAKDDEIVGALNLTPVVGGHWLTGVFVAPSRRREGVAGRLIEAALGEVEGPVWLFCDPELSGFYQRLGFVAAEHLPAELNGRLARYRQTKTLIALVQQR
jgi:GNAT superfamily N-acetyltransferase